MNLTTYLHLVPWSKKAELYFHSPNTPSWRGAQLKNAGTTLPLFYLYFYCEDETCIELAQGRIDF